MKFANAIKFYRKYGRSPTIAFAQSSKSKMPRSQPAPNLNVHFPPTTTAFMMHKTRFNSLYDTMREPLQCTF
jgi:hypothetical protein